MSALSEQCESLRLWAKHLREGEPALASDLREAADTILNLRDMAQQAQSEKAALERRIDELCAEVERGKAEFKKMDVWHSQELKAAMDENVKLRELFNETLIRLAAANEAAGGGFIDARYCELLESHGIEAG